MCLKDNDAIFSHYPKFAFSPSPKQRPFSTSFPSYTYTNFPFELLNSTYLLTKYLYVYLFSCRTIKIELFPSKYLLLRV